MKTANKKAYIFVAAFIALALVLYLKTRSTQQAEVLNPTQSDTPNIAANPNVGRGRLATQANQAGGFATTAGSPANGNGQNNGVSQVPDRSASSEGQKPNDQGSPKPMQPFEFAQLTKQALDTLPKGSDLKAAAAANKNEAHHLSPEIIAKVQVLADVVDAVSGNPELEMSALNFYQTCAQREDLLVSVRARCLSHLKVLADRHSQAVDFDKYPPDVKRLANYIP